ncbi:MAG: hypothetical protein NT118_02730 [Lentisphaerae bacterium]|nr:hypothetical protein [Lentisphaerota bacterium]
MFGKSLSIRRQRNIRRKLSTNTTISPIAEYFQMPVVDQAAKKPLERVLWSGVDHHAKTAVRYRMSKLHAFLTVACDKDVGHCESIAPDDTPSRSAAKVSNSRIVREIEEDL